MARDASREWFTLAGGIQYDAARLGIGRPRPNAHAAESKLPPAISRFDELVTDSGLRSVSRKLFEDGHYARAVGEAFKFLINEVKTKSGKSDLDGDNLMRQVFSPKSPTLALNSLRSTSEQDEQRGYMDLFAGAVTGIRNPRAHEHLEDSPEAALEMLVLANHLMRKLDQATKQPYKESR